MRRLLVVLLAPKAIAAPDLATPRGALHDELPLLRPWQGALERDAPRTLRGRAVRCATCGCPRFADHGP